MKYMVLSKKSLLIILLITVLIVSSVIIAIRVNTTLTVSTTERLLPIYRVSTDSNQIALTFNAAWEADEVPTVLEILEKYNAKCTFFVLGEFAEKNPEAIKMITDAGHEIGNHSDSHPDMTSMAPTKISDEIKKCDEIISQKSTSGVRLFRAPSGAYSNSVITVADKLGHTVIQWDVDSRDWMTDSSINSIYKNSTTNTTSGSIILFHIGTKNGYTPEALPLVLDNLSSKGFTFVKVSELIYPTGSDISYIDLKGEQHLKSTSAN